MKNNLVLLILFVIFFTSCEKVIVVKLDEGATQLAIDAFLNNKQGAQKIRLTKTSGYFNNAPSPAATGASVKITDNEGRVYNFTDVNNNGDYVWTPFPGDTLVRYFNSYTLSVTYSGEEFMGSSIAYPSPFIDSVRYTTKQESGSGGSTTGEQGYFASFYAYDISGITNFYWIKTYKNDTLFSGSRDINVCIDGTGGEVYDVNVDSTAFTPPSTFLNFKRYNKNDVCNVEIHSISKDSYFFFIQALAQINNGGLFAKTPENIKTNIVTPKEAKTKAVGQFNMATVVSAKKVIK